MDLSKTLNSACSKASTDRIIRWVGRSPSRFAELVTCLLKGSTEVQVRAAWPLTYCAENNPELMKPHLGKMVRMLRRRDLDGAVIRSIVRLLQFVEVPRPLQGEVADHCFRYLADPSEAPAVRAFAMKVAENLALKNSGLQAELRIILEDQLPYAPPAFVSRATKILGIKRDCRE